MTEPMCDVCCTPPLDVFERFVDTTWLEAYCPMCVTGVCFSVDFRSISRRELTGTQRGILVS